MSIELEEPGQAQGEGGWSLLQALPSGYAPCGLSQVSLTSSPHSSAPAAKWLGQGVPVQAPSLLPMAPMPVPGRPAVPGWPDILCPSKLLMESLVVQEPSSSGTGQQRETKRGAPEVLGLGQLQGLD